MQAANLQDRAVLAMWSVYQVRLIINHNFLADLDGVMDDEPS